MRKSVYALLALGLLLITLMGCLAYVPPPPVDAVYAPGPPPAPVVEVAPAVPYPGAVWIGVAVPSRTCRVRGPILCMKSRRLFASCRS